MIRIIFLTLVPWLTCALASATENQVPSKLSSVASSDIRVVKVVDVSWGNPRGRLVSGTLSVSLSTTIRGKQDKAGTVSKIEICKGSGLIQSGGYPWTQLPMEKGTQLVLFLAKDDIPGVYDPWRTPVGDLKIIDVKPYTESLAHDLALIEKCLHAKDIGDAILEVLKKPNDWGEDFANFASESLFRRKLTKPDVRLEVIKLCITEKLPMPVRMSLIYYVDYYLGSESGKLPAEEVQLLAQLFIRNLLVSKPTDYRLGLVMGLREMLVDQGLSNKVVIAKADFGPLLKVVKSVENFDVMKPLVEVLQKMEKQKR